MLPPVFASAIAYANTPEVRQSADHPVNAKLPSASASVVSSQVGQSSAIAGQLNLMMLSGPESMSRNLATLAEVLGSALGIEQRAEEGLSDYMARLIEGIASLPGSDRLKLQKLLTQAFAGLQLRTLLDAMANTSGPERATLALYLELYRQPDKDGGARSVISSYREIAAEGRENPLAPLRPVPANDGLGDRVGPLRSDPKPALQTPPASPADGSFRRAADAPSPGLATFSRTMMSAAQDPQRVPLAPQWKAAMGPPERPVGLAPASASVPDSMAEFAKPGITRETLQNATNPASAQPSARQGPVGSDLAAHSQTVARSGEAHRPGNAAKDQAQTVDAAMQPLAQLPKPMLPLPAVWIAELLESDLVKSLMQLKTLSAEQQGGGPQIGSSARQEPGALSTSPEAAEGAQRARSEEEVTHAPQTGSTPVQADETEASPIMIPVEQTMLRPLIAREGVPLPFVLYMIEDEGQTGQVEEEDGDEEEEEDQEDAKQRRQHKDGERNGDAVPGPQSDEALTATDTGSAGHDDPAEMPTALHNDRRASPALPAASETAVPLAPQPAHQLYLRMAGLN